MRRLPVGRQVLRRRNLDTLASETVSLAIPMDEAHTEQTFRSPRRGGQRCGQSGLVSTSTGSWGVLELRAASSGTQPRRCPIAFEADLVASCRLVLQGQRELAELPPSKRAESVSSHSSGAYTKSNGKDSLLLAHSPESWTGINSEKVSGHDQPCDQTTQGRCEKRYVSVSHRQPGSGDGGAEARSSQTLLRSTTHAYCREAMGHGGAAGEAAHLTHGLFARPIPATATAGTLSRCSTAPGSLVAPQRILVTARIIGEAVGSAINTDSAARSRLNNRVTAVNSETTGWTAISYGEDNTSPRGGNSVQKEFGSFSYGEGDTSLRGGKSLKLCQQFPWNFGSTRKHCVSLF